MAAYDFRCVGCDASFEVSRPIGASGPVPCPDCRGVDTKQVYSPTGCVRRGRTAETRHPSTGERVHVKEVIHETTGGTAGYLVHRQGGQVDSLITPPPIQMKSRPRTPGAAS